MAKIVLIHGIGQEQYAADKLEAEWLPALAGGIRTSGFPQIADLMWRERHRQGAIEARMAFYGHLFLRPDQQGIDPCELDSEQTVLADQLAELWLRRAADRASSLKEKATAARELAHITGTVGIEEQGYKSGIREVVKSLAKLRWFATLGMAVAERLVVKSLVQVTRYMTDESVRMEVQRILKGLIAPDTQIIIGHSLGSIIAYEAAHHLERPLLLLVTIGSPLGLDTIVYPRLRPQPPVFPPRVLRWVNVADRDDFIAAEPDLTKLFSAAMPPEAKFESSYTVENGAEPHSAVFYLTKAITGRPIGETLRDAS
jgi:hypothetical protein